MGSRGRLFLGLTSLVLLGQVATVQPAYAEDISGVQPVAFDDSIPDPLKLSAKLLLEQEMVAVTAGLLATGAATPVGQPQDLGPTCAGDPCTESPPRSAILRVTAQLQERERWCVPAVGRLTLSGAGVSVSQSDGAAAMSTNDASGTNFGRLSSYLNSRQSRNTYILSQGTTAAELMNRSVTDISRRRSALDMRVQGRFLPWWSSRGLTGDHALAIYGYWTESSGGLYLYDPLNRQGVGGPHTLPIGTASQANASLGGNLVW